MMDPKSHWQGIYAKRSAKEVSWYRTHLDKSLELIARCNLPKSAAIVDVGGGASTLADDLLHQGFTNVTVIDLADSALAQAQARLGETARSIHWVQGDATTPLLADASVDLWHDRAVFHFLTEAAARAAYVEQVTRCVRSGGFCVLGTFALDGPERCSGLPVVRYSPDGLAAALGPAFEHVASEREEHVTPSGAPQPFSFVVCRRKPR